MKITKYEHACLSVLKDDHVLIVDPGNFTTDFIAPDHVVAVIITHTHADHLDHEQLAAIIDKNPAAVIVGHPEITQTIEAFQTKEVLAGDHLTLGPFSVSFYGGEHAVIHQDLPAVANLGVLIDDLLYYPGDSLVRPGVAVDTLALPVAAPWLKIGESIEFARDIAPRLAFPTHDAILSDSGKALIDTLVPKLVPSVEYRRIDGDTIEI